MVIRVALKKTDRLISLDFFRGAVILLMILINSGGGGAYSQLRHSIWNGWTLADAVFPFFLWIMGVALVFSFVKRISEGHSKKELFSHVLKRSFLLFAFGFFLNLFPFFDFASVRISGVLQLIAVTYFFAGLILLYVPVKWQAVLAVFILVSSGLMLSVMPVPGYGAGVLEPGRNFAHYIDNLVLSGHMWEETKTWDPEGVFSMFSAISTVLLGILAGHLLISKKTKLQKFGLMILSGAVLIIIGYIINIWLPINKSLWTSSFSVFMVGLALVIFAASYWIIDIKDCKKWSLPFVIFGLNALTLYLISSIINKLLVVIEISGISLYDRIYQNIYLAIAGPGIASLLFALTHMLVILCIAYLMYRQKWFLKI